MVKACLPAFLLAALLSTAALAREGGPAGIGVGAFIPEGDLADVNKTSYCVQTRVVLAKKWFGFRAGAYYGDTTAHGAIDGGRAYGSDFEGVIKFGGSSTFGYVFAGPGYGRASFTRPSGSVLGGLTRSSEWDWTMQGGVGIVINKLVYIEAMYLQFQTDPKSSFIPVVIGFQY
jgi:hypothetical protein